MLSLCSWVSPHDGPSSASLESQPGKATEPQPQKKAELKTTWASPTAASAKVEARCSGSVRPRLSWCWDVATGAQVCAAGAAAEKEMGGVGRNEMFFLSLRSFAVPGRLMVWAVLVVDFTQGGSHTSR